LRRDEIWVAEKGADGNSSLIPISCYKDLRYGKDLHKTYLRGVLGGAPRLQTQAVGIPFAEEMSKQKGARSFRETTKGTRAEFVIVPEGSKTEIEYFNAVRPFFPKVVLSVIRSKQGSPPQGSQGDEEHPAGPQSERQVAPALHGS